MKESVEQAFSFTTSHSHSRQSPTLGPPGFTLLEPPRPTSRQSQDSTVSENTKDCSRYELNDGVGCGQRSRTCSIARVHKHTIKRNTATVRMSISTRTHV